MDSDLPAFDGRHPLWVNALRTRLHGFLAAWTALLFVAGSGHAPHRALPDSQKTAHSNASNCGF